MLQSIAKQLCLQVNCFPDRIEKVIQDKYHKEEWLDESSLMLIIRTLAENFESVYVVVDALDECVEVPYLLKSLSTLASQKLNNVHTLMTSRDLPEIRRSMDRLATIHIPIGSSEKRYTGIDNDIELFIRQSLAEQYYLSIRTNKIKRKIIETLVTQACGMYAVIIYLLCFTTLIYSTSGFAGFPVSSTSCLSP